MAETGLPLVAAALRQGEGASSDFDLTPGAGQPAGRRLRPAAVLVALLPGPAGLEVLLTKRSSKLRHHPGQIAFPGGRLDPGDGGSPEAAALREAQEEVGLDPALVRVLGRLPPHETVTSFHVTPVVAELAARFEPVAEAGEVEEVFTVPLDFLADPANFRVEGRRWQGTRRHYYAVPWGPYYIWGATARILKGLADRVAACR
ncbi:CoA pyrophosphatase [Mangrovicoccus algicola]|uniref:CoA pyrophosphatase n=1 Tax=Mangrovicoccus algicola TaxID=2771008 RepID=A0A8J6Z8B6_9RHOB|nr:CoA pyrophosphatase [Mangrovicoccus algicola]MBE3638240.1 CoA pyrophosphatase [Mangrovicoccus algicola]